MDHVNKRRRLSCSSSSHFQDSDDDGSLCLPKDNTGGDVGSITGSRSLSSRVHAQKGSKTERHSMADRSASFDPAPSSSVSLLQMQVRQLLADVDEKHNELGTIVNSILKHLERIIYAIPVHNSVPVNEARKLLNDAYGKNVCLPQGGPKLGVQYTFSYEKPTRIDATSNHALQTTPKSKETRTIDIIVAMPSAIFQAKDYKDFRYFHKRAYFLACIITAIRKDKDVGFHIQFGYDDDCRLQPIILLTPLGSTANLPSTRRKLQLRMLTAIDGDIFPARKPLPWDNCFRLVSAVPTDSEASSNSTLLYNSALRAECSRLSYRKLEADVCERCPGYRDACKLGNLWLHQRGYKGGISTHGFGPSEFAILMSLLLSGGISFGRSILSFGYDEIQLFKGVLRYLATRDLIEIPAVFGDTIDFSLHGPSQGPMLYDTTRGQNILYKMSLWSYRSLVNDARITLKVLNAVPSRNQELEDAFITKIDQPLLRYDMIMRVSIPMSWPSKPPEPLIQDRTMVFTSKLYQILREGLGDRVTMINLQRSDLPAQHLGSMQNRREEDLAIVVQLLLNPQQCNRSVDRGPSAEEKHAASAFRRFWGEKAELRRYQDGSILESLIWSQGHSEGSVCEQIIRHLIKRHFGQESGQYLTCFANNFYLPLCDYEKQVYQSVTLYNPILSAYEQLEKQLRNIEELPLQVRRITTSSEQLRYASISTTGDVISQANNGPIDLLIQFEGSSRWPNSLPAIQRTKIAFLTKIGQLLDRPILGYRTQLGLENTTKQPFQNLPFLDLIPFNQPRIAFRLRIYHEQELAILEIQLKGKTTNPHHRTLVANAATAYKRKFLHGPLHTQVVASLCISHPLLSPTIRLVKIWCITHLLPAYLLPAEILELLTIQCFVTPLPWSQPPASIRTGFLRTLSLLAKWDWAREPMIIDTNNEMKQNEREAIQLRFEAWRKIDPSMNRVTYFIASTMDPSGVAWTERAVEKVIGKRLQSLAKAACQLVHDQGYKTDVRMLFTHSLTDYDFLIHLNETHIEGLQGYRTKSEIHFKNLQTQSEPQVSLSTGSESVDFFVEELRSVYKESLVLFYNPSRPKSVGGIWHPSVLAARPWKVGLSHSTVPSLEREQRIEDGKAGKADINLNRDGVLREIRCLGGDLVKGIEILKHED